MFEEFIAYIGKIFNTRTDDIAVNIFAALIVILVSSLFALVVWLGFIPKKIWQGTKKVLKFYMNIENKSLEITTTETPETTSGLKQMIKNADDGDPIAQYMLGALCWNGKGVPQDRAKALKLWHQSAKQGNLESLLGLGFLYSEGEGVDIDEEKGFAFYKTAADNGSVDAQSIVAIKYSEGRGVKKNLEESFKWWLKAAKKGDLLSQYNVGYLYSEGISVKQDYVQSRNWNHRAAIQGYNSAQVNLGILYYHGQGGEQDLPQAYAWCTLASETNESMTKEKALRYLGYMKKAMTPDQILDAQAILKELQRQIRMKKKPNTS